MPKYLSVFTIKIGGANVSEIFYNDLQEVLVDTSLNMPGMFCIRLHDDDLSWVDNALLDIGKEVEIAAVQDEISSGSATSASKILIKGEVTSLEPSYSSDGGSCMLVRGYDKSHRLHHGTKTRTFLKMKDSDVVNTVASEAGLSTQVDATTLVIDFIMQYNQTNYEFIKSRAERIGYQFSVADGKITFKKGDPLPSPISATLTFMENLISFEPRWTAVHQSDKFKVLGWDSKEKKAIVGQKTPKSDLNQGGMTGTGGAKAQSAFGSAEAIFVDRPVDTISQAEALADGMSTDVSLGYVQAEGICGGSPGVQAGKVIEIKGIGSRFSGKYFVTSAVHTINNSGYKTHFSISGRNPNTLISLVAPRDHGGQAQGLVNGMVTALVTNLQDPEDRGRVKVKYPWLGDAIESDWIRIAVPMAGAARGTMVLPEVNDEVLIGFEHGDIHHPYIVGFLWSNIDKPPLKNSEVVDGGKVSQRVFKTRKGHLVIFNDKDGEEQISVKSKSGHQIVLNDKSGSESITIKDKTGNNSMIINSTANSMAIKVAGDFSVEATGKITMKSTGAMNLEAVSDAKVKGMNVAVEGTMKSEVKGVSVSVNGSAQTEVKAGGIVTVQGALVKIN